MKHKQTQITQEELIEKLAQNHIDVETFKQLSTSNESETHCSSPTYLSNQMTKTISHISKGKLTLEDIAPLIGDITITQTKQLQGIYLKHSPINIVEQSHLIPCERNENL
ncbi:hypothetical protein CTR57_012015 [Staphylococcus epidermidis]|nr:hypothetical protein CTR57_012015 [Staphylococcus epidermidis]